MNVTRTLQERYKNNSNSNKLESFDYIIDLEK